MHRRLIFVIGGPGAGKSTQCARLASLLGIQHISVGALLRNADDPAIQDRLREGRFVEGTVAADLLRDALERTPPASFVLVDGFPRTVGNIEAWNALRGMPPPDRVIYLECPCAALETRLLTRNDGRPDDAPGAVRERLWHFRAQTAPVLRYYETRRLLHRIDAARDPDTVMASMRDLLFA